MKTSVKYVHELTPTDVRKILLDHFGGGGDVFLQFEINDSDEPELSGARVEITKEKES